MLPIQMSARQLSQAIHRREWSCREVMQAFLAQIARHNPTHNAIVNLQDTDGLMKQADQHDAMLAQGQSMGWMHGMPIAIKDLAATAGIPSTQGTPLLKDFVPGEDAAMGHRYPWIAYSTVREKTCVTMTLAMKVINPGMLSTPPVLIFSQTKPAGSSSAVSKSRQPASSGVTDGRAISCLASSRVSMATAWTFVEE